MMMRKRLSSLFRGVAIACGMLLAFPVVVLAQTSAEDVLRGISQGVDRPSDPRKLIGVVCALVGLLVLLVMIHNRRARQTNPKPVNHAGKLTRELVKAVALRPVELKKLKALAEQVSHRINEPLVSPLLLILCPSLLTPAPAVETPAEIVPPQETIGDEI
jgi:hypothetical protein